MKTTFSIVKIIIFPGDVFPLTQNSTFIVCFILLCVFPLMFSARPTELRVGS